MPETDKEEKAVAASDLDTGRRLGRRVSNGSVALRKFQPGQRGILLNESHVLQGWTCMNTPIMLGQQQQLVWLHWIQRGSSQSSESAMLLIAADVRSAFSWLP